MVVSGVRPPISSLATVYSRVAGEAAPYRVHIIGSSKALADIEQARIGAEGAGPLPAGAEGWTPPKRIV